MRYTVAASSPTSIHKDIPPEFIKKLTDLINVHSLEGGSNTRDFILAEYLVDCLRAYNKSVTENTRLTASSFICGPQHDKGGQPAKSVADAIATLEDLIAVQSSPGNYDYDEYMHGLGNGLICALSVLTGCTPQYLDAPKEWIVNKKVKSELTVTTSSSYSNVVENCIKQIVIALDAQDIDTVGKAYAVFKRIGWIGFKAPKICSPAEKKITRACTITTKAKKIFWVFLRTTDKGIEYQMSKPGSENYTSIKVTRKTTNISKFLEQCLKVRGLSEYADKIKKELEEN